MRKRFLLGALFAAPVLAAAMATTLFPGQRLGMALRVASGFGTGSLQREIDRLEEKAIVGDSFAEQERAFLVDFYRTLATGARLTFVLRQSAALMDHYLDCSGEEFELDPRIFVQNKRVQSKMEGLRQQVRGLSCDQKLRRTTGPFYMPDESNADSVFGLYHGSLTVELGRSSAGICTLHWRAEVPWEWPSYDDLRTEYGSPHAESFPLPNARSIVFGRQYSLFVDNGLGEYLTRLGIARSFVAFAEWKEPAE